MPTSKSPYTPSQEILANYARVLINFALGSGKGIQPGEIVYVQFDALALPLAIEVSKCILKSGGHPITKMNEEALQKVYIDHASENQLAFFPKKYMRSLVDTIDHRICLLYTSRCV